MRKRRVLIFDDEVMILDVLRDFFAYRGYEVQTHAEPAVCPLHGDISSCPEKTPCCDVIMTDYQMPGMNGIELLRQQARRGCKLTVENKAVMSGYFDHEKLESIGRLGCKYFEKPISFDDLGRWVDACEKRMDSSLAQKSTRRETRYDSYQEIFYKTSRGDEVFCGVAVNRSDSGICLRVKGPLSAEQPIRLHTGHPQTFQTASVRWVRPTPDGAYLAGLTYAPVQAGA
jgi:DNA-binding NtrC family response regulator